jgi:predicted nucleic acid-binding protein
MIFLDANMFLRVLGGGGSAQVQVALDLLTRIQQGDGQATTSEVVIHHVCYVLGSKRQYGRKDVEIVDAMTDVLSWPGFWFPRGEQEIYLRALKLWADYPHLEFSNSVIAARCERAGHELATFDRHFRDLSFLQVWQPDAPAVGNP